MPPRLKPGRQRVPIDPGELAQLTSMLEAMTEDDALARALGENRRRSEVMADAQKFGPPSPIDLKQNPTGTAPSATSASDDS